MILWGILVVFYMILGFKRNVLGFDYYLRVVLFIFDFERVDGREVKRFFCMLY